MDLSKKIYPGCRAYVQVGIRWIYIGVPMIPDNFLFRPVLDTVIVPRRLDFPGTSLALILCDAVEHLYSQVKRGLAP